MASFVLNFNRACRIAPDGTRVPESESESQASSISETSSDAGIRTYYDDYSATVGDEKVVEKTSAVPRPNVTTEVNQNQQLPAPHVMVA